MEKLQVQSIIAGLQQGKGNNPKLVKETPKALPNKTAKRLARKKLYNQQGCQIGQLGTSPVANKLSRQERRNGKGEFTPQYNGQRFKKVNTLVQDENKSYKKNINTTYELI